MRLKNFLKFIFAAPYALRKIKTHESYFLLHMYGSGFGDSLKYFALYLLKTRPSAKIYFPLNSSSKAPNIQGISFVPMHSFTYYKRLFQSKYVISNYRLSVDDYPIKLKEQKYIQLWHGFPLKKIEADASLSLKSRKRSMRDSALIDFFCVGSSHLEKIVLKSFWYTGEVVITGSPRCEIFFWSSEKLSAVQRQVRKQLNIKQNQKILLYAPTFRSHKGKESHFAYNLDFPLLLRSIEHRFGDSWVVVIRHHPSLIKHSFYTSLLPKNVNFIDASLYPDMQELLASSDILLTDYSSCIFDFSLSGKPAFIYAPDSNEYDRGFYFPLDSTPFPVAFNQDQLCANIQSFNNAEYKEKLHSFNKKFGLDHESMHSSRNLYELIHSPEK